LATNIVGDTYDYTATNPNADGFPTMVTNSAPSNIASTRSPIGDVHAAVQGSEGAIYYEAYVTASDTWSGWSALSNGATANTPAIAVVGATEYFVVKGSDGESLWFASRNLADGSFSGWTWLSGSTPSAPTLVTDGMRLILVVRGSDSRVYYRVYDIATQLWSNWRGISTGFTSEKPTAAMLGNKLYIVVRGITLGSNSVYYGTVDMENDDFSGWKAVGGSTPSAPVLATLHTVNGLCLAVRGDDNQIYVNRWNGVSWQGWNVISLGSTVSSPAIAVYQNTLHMIVIGLDGSSLWYNSMNLTTNVASGWTPLMGSSPSAPTITR
jgi:hypothetical protein